MKVEIKPMRIKKSPENQVTSSNVFKKNQRKVRDEYEFDENGIFSRKIFGRIGSCDCGELKKPGYCELCHCRVVDEFNMPEFYIDLGVMVPKFCADWGKYKNVKSLLTFKAFLVDYGDGKYKIVEDDDQIDFDEFDPYKIVIGYDAAKLIHDDIDEWAERYMTDFISVPHTLHRANLRMDNGKILLSPINKSLVGVLQGLERIEQYRSIFPGESDDPTFNYFMLSFYSEIYTQYLNCMKEIYNQFTGGKQSFIGSDIRAHRVTSAIKGTVVNRFDIDEDIILIGDTFVQTLWPWLYKKYDGDMEKINDYLVESNSVVIVNRPPTICHLSIMGMKPRIASCYKLGTFTDGAVDKNAKSDYDENIDTIGIRTVAINPIVTDGIAGDFDGDLLLVVSIFSDKAKEEALSMLPSKNFMNYANGTIRNVIIEDVMFANK